MMTDNEIIKALDFCEGYNGVSFCNDCPLFDKDNCEHILSHEAYNLINRQKAEIENLKDILYDTEGVNLVNYWHQQCKIVENGCRNFDEENKNLKAEIERYKSGMMANAEVVKTVTTELKKAKSEAIKEFAERFEYFVLHEDIEVVEPKCKDYESYINGANQFRHQIKNGINNLVKEMMEVETNQRKEDEGK